MLNYTDEPFDGSCCLFSFSPCESLVPGTVTYFPLRVSPIQLVDRRVLGGERAEQSFTRKGVLCVSREKYFDRRHVRTRLLIVEKKGHSDSKCRQVCDKNQVVIQYSKFRQSYHKQAVSLDIQRGNIARRRSGEIYFCLLVRQHRPSKRDAQDILANLGDRRDTGLTGENAQNVVQKPGWQTLG